MTLKRTFWGSSLIRLIFAVAIIAAGIAVAVSWAGVTGARPGISHAMMTPARATGGIDGDFYFFS
jgi:hypothetical protein